MHRDIVDHISYDRGYNTGHEEGYEKGKKEAWDLVGKLAEWYKAQLRHEARESIPSVDQVFEHEQSLRAGGRYEAALYAQQVIKKGCI